MREFEFYNEWHLGDSVFHVNFMRKLVNLKGDSFVYYVKPEYIPELEKHLIGYKLRIRLAPLNERTPTAINAWIGVIYYNHPTNYIYDKFYIDWFNYLTMQMYGENLNIDIINGYSVSDKEVDTYEVLFINSIPQSMQFDYQELNLNASIQRLANKCKVITTRHVPTLPCTLDLGYSLVDIGNVAKKAQAVIAINTAPITTCFSVESLQNVKLWVIGDRKTTYSFDNIHRVGNSLDMCKCIDAIGEVK